MGVSDQHRKMNSLGEALSFMASARHDPVARMLNVDLVAVLVLARVEGVVAQALRLEPLDVGDVGHQREDHQQGQDPGRLDGLVHAAPHPPMSRDHSS